MLQHIRMAHFDIHKYFIGCKHGKVDQNSALLY